MPRVKGPLSDYEEIINDPHAETPFMCKNCAAKYSNSDEGWYRKTQARKEEERALAERQIRLAAMMYGKDGEVFINKVKFTKHDYLCPQCRPRKPYVRKTAEEKAKLKEEKETRARLKKEAYDKKWDPAFNCGFHKEDSMICLPKAEEPPQIDWKQ